MSRSELPPHQALSARGKWPVVGERAPRVAVEPWQIAVTGLVEAPQRWSLDEVRGLGLESRTIDIHCVTRWSRLASRFRGVPLHRLLDAAGPLPEARFVSFGARSERGHSTSLPLDVVRDLDALVAFEFEEAPLEPVHGGPVRVVVPGRYFYKSVKWLESIELLADDRLGYWEAEAGYHNEADPWREQRYIASNLDRRAARALLESRNVAGLDLLSLAAPHLPLPGLNARAALLRNADFRHADLRGACFDGANLSNAHLDDADLRGATFRDADVEGASFVGADLRGASLRGASLFGATFTVEPSDPPRSSARLDATTEITTAQLAALSDAQQAFLRPYATR